MLADPANPLGPVPVPCTVGHGTMLDDALHPAVATLQVVSLAGGAIDPAPMTDCKGSAWHTVDKVRLNHGAVGAALGPAAVVLSAIEPSRLLEGRPSVSCPCQRSLSMGNSVDATSGPRHRACRAEMVNPDVAAESVNYFLPAGRAFVLARASWLRSTCPFDFCQQRRIDKRLTALRPFDPEPFASFPGHSYRIAGFQQADLVILGSGAAPQVRPRPAPA